MKASQPVISAQALLRSASGQRLRGEDAITAENIGRYLPSSEDAAAARSAFRAAGFEVGEVVGISFSVTASPATFTKFFGAELRILPDGAVEVIEGEGSRGFELPLEKLPKALSGLLVAVTFTPPADLYGERPGLMI